jgi:hypothetical protein
VEAALRSSDVEVDLGMEAALDSDGGEVALGSFGMRRCQAHGDTAVEVALRSSGVEAAHHVEAGFSEEAVLDSDGGEVSSRRAQI